MKRLRSCAPRVQYRKLYFPEHPEQLRDGVTSVRLAQGDPAHANGLGTLSAQNTRHVFQSARPCRTSIEPSGQHHSIGCHSTVEVCPHTARCPLESIAAPKNPIKTSSLALISMPCNQHAPQSQPPLRLATALGEDLGLALALAKTIRNI